MLTGTQQQYTFKICRVVLDPDSFIRQLFGLQNDDSNVGHDKKS